MEYTYHYTSPLGEITLASDGEKLSGLWFVGQKFFAKTLEKEHEEKHLPIFDETNRWLDRYFRGKLPDFTPPLSPKGTPFRRSVWEIQHMSAQAVGGAVGHNPISLIIPCHRVLGADGSLIGYAGGLERKRWLLRLENNLLSESEDLQTL